MCSKRNKKEAGECMKQQIGSMLHVLPSPNGIILTVHNGNLSACSVRMQQQREKNAATTQTSDSPREF